VKEKLGEGNKTDLLQDHIIPLLSLYLIPVSNQDHIFLYPHHLLRGRQSEVLPHALFLYHANLIGYFLGHLVMLYGDLLLLLSSMGGGRIYGGSRPAISTFPYSCSRRSRVSRRCRGYDIDIPHLGSLGHPSISGVLSLLSTLSSQEASILAQSSIEHKRLDYSSVSFPQFRNLTGQGNKAVI